MADNTALYVFLFIVFFAIDVACCYFRMKIYEAICSSAMDNSNRGGTRSGQADHVQQSPHQGVVLVGNKPQPKKSADQLADLCSGARSLKRPD